MQDETLQLFRVAVESIFGRMNFIVKSEKLGFEIVNENRRIENLVARST